MKPKKDPQKHLVCEIYLSDSGEVTYEIKGLSPLDMAMVSMNFLSSFIGSLKNQAPKPKETKSGIKLIS